MWLVWKQLSHTIELKNRRKLQGIKACHLKKNLPHLFQNLFLLWFWNFEAIGSLVTIIGWYWPIINQQGHDRPVRGHCSVSVNVLKVAFMLRRFNILTFKHLCVGSVLFCPQRILGEPCPRQPPPTDPAFGLLIIPKEGGGGVSLAQLRLLGPPCQSPKYLFSILIQKKQKQSRNKSCTLWAIIVEIADGLYITSWSEN